MTPGGDEYVYDDDTLGPGPWQVSVSGMYLFPDDAELESVAGIPVSSFTDIELDDGWAAMVAIARHLGLFRGEFEYSYPTPGSIRSARRCCRRSAATASCPPTR